MANPLSDSEILAAYEALPPAPKLSLAALEKGAQKSAEELVKGLEIAPKLSPTAPCGFVLPFVLNAFLDFVKELAEKRSIPSISLLRLEYGRVLDAMVTFANSVWTDQEKEAYESCSCRQHDRHGVKLFNEIHGDDAFGNRRRNSHFHTLVTAVFVTISQVPASISNSTEDAIRLERNSKKGGKWPTSASKFIPHGAEATVVAFTRWAQLVKHPAPIASLCSLTECCLSLEFPMAQTAQLPALLTTLFSEFVSPLRKLKLEGVGLDRKKVLQHEIKHFYICLNEKWFLDLSDIAQTDRAVASTLASFYTTICDFLPLISKCGYVGEQEDRVTGRFVGTALNIHTAISTVLPALGPLHPFLVPYDHDTNDFECVPFVSGFLFSLVVFRSQPKCAHIPCNNTPKSTKTKFKICSACQAVCYCSKECQVADWKPHKLVCKVMKWVLPFALSYHASDSTHVPEELVDRFLAHIKEGNFTTEEVSLVSGYVGMRKALPGEQDISTSTP